MSALVRFLYPLAPTERSPGAVLRWWERRRVVYNVAVGAAGLTSLAVATLFGVLPLFRQGLIFSVGLSLLPILIAGLGWIARVFFALIH